MVELSHFYNFFMDARTEENIWKYMDINYK